MLQLHPLPKGIQTTKAGFVWGEIEAKGEGILEVPFPAFSFCQISTNLLRILDAFLPFLFYPYQTCTPPRHQTAEILVSSQLRYPQLVSKLGWNIFAIFL